MKNFTLNGPQLKSAILNAKDNIDIWSRATGKSNFMGWKIQRDLRYMPRASKVIVGQTYTQLLTRTLPPLVKFLESIGIYKGVHYFIGERPPKSWGWKEPYEPPLKYEHFIIFYNGLGYHLASQDRIGSSRGLNVDGIMGDEALLLNKKRFDDEILATNRGNLNHFGHLSWHHGIDLCSSMPYTQESKWLLDYGNYYEKEAGIRLFDLWNKVVNLQMELIDIAIKYDETESEKERLEISGEFASQWNETLRVRKKIMPFIAKDGTLFTLANVFDNIENVGMSFIKQQYRKMTRLTFMIEIMNMIMDKVEDAYYHLNNEVHIYYDSYDYSFIDGYGYNFQKLTNIDSRYDKDCDPYSPLEVVIDFGSQITFMLVSQSKPGNYHHFIKEFFTKPDVGNVPIDDIVDDFDRYYRHHRERTIHYFKDRFGDNKLANSSNTYNSQVISRFESKGWTVIPFMHKGKEPPHHEKYLLWSNILKEQDPDLPCIRINGNNCKNFIIAVNNTKVIEKDNKYSKDKKSEHINSATPPEESTHSTDAADKIIWTKYGHFKRSPGGFIPVRIGKS